MQMLNSHRTETAPEIIGFSISTTQVDDLYKKCFFEYLGEKAVFYIHLVENIFEWLL